MSKNGAGYDPDIEDVPNDFGYAKDDRDLVDALELHHVEGSYAEPEIEELAIAEAVLVEIRGAWFVHVKFTNGNAKEYTLEEYNKMVPIPIVPPHKLPAKQNTNG